MSQSGSFSLTLCFGAFVCVWLCLCGIHHLLPWRKEQWLLPCLVSVLSVRIPCVSSNKCHPSLVTTELLFQLQLLNSQDIPFQMDHHSLHFAPFIPLCIYGREEGQAIRDQRMPVSFHLYLRVRAFLYSHQLVNSDPQSKYWWHIFHFSNFCFWFFWKMPPSTTMKITEYLR